MDRKTIAQRQEYHQKCADALGTILMCTDLKVSAMRPKEEMANTIIEQQHVYGHNLSAIIQPVFDGVFNEQEITLK